MQGVMPHETADRTQQPIADGKISLPRFLAIGVQLGLMTLVVRQFAIESQAFVQITLLACAGFAVHSFLPLRHRLPFFVALSMTSIGAVLGLEAGAWLVGIGLALIGVCHLPVSFRLRAALLVLLGGGLAVLRVDWFHAPWPQAIWPILGSMFMFRLIAYLYDLSHEKVPPSGWRTLAYFFLLPNVCFPLFPVVDYKTFRRNYYDEGAYRIYQRGVDWMVRGVVHLILYRVVYYYYTMAPSEVASPAGLGQYMVSTFLLYLRVSGQFHIIVGMLHLFGFNLPETHHLYYLASSFTDFWRRINIYWKDFMLKVFYYPAYFKLRKWGPDTALVASTLFVFLMTWLLHSYQWFWLRGRFPLTGTDVVFWGTLAVLVAGSALYETRHVRHRTLGRAQWSPRRAAGLALRTAGTFVVICILWSLWTSESLSAWASLWMDLGAVGPNTRWLLPVLVLAAVMGSAVWQVIGGGQPGGVGRWLRSPRWAPVATVTLLLVLVAIGRYRVYSRLGPEVATLVHSVRSGGLSRVDAALMERGYYEDLLRVDRFNSQLWEVYMNKPAKWLEAFEQAGLGRFAERGVCPCRTGRTGLERFVDGFLQKELIPSSVAVHSFGTMRTNRWGMRDKEYEKVLPSNTHRVALLGASATMGWGVSDGETYEALVERRLNQERERAPYAQFEMLNFAVPGYQPLQQLPVLEKVFSFRPNALFYVATGRELSNGTYYLAEAVRYKFEIPYEFLRDIVQRANVEPSMDQALLLRRLEPFRREVLSWLYQSIVERCRERGVAPVWVFLPEVERGAWEQEAIGIDRIAADAGFTILSLMDVFKGQDRKALRLAQWDAHPNARGHQFIAQGLYRALVENERALLARGATTPRRSAVHDRVVRGMNDPQRVSIGVANGANP